MNCHLNRLFISFAAVLILVQTAAAATISGKISDTQTGEALIGATIMIDGTSIGAAASLDGSFLIESAPAGELLLRASIIGYETLEQSLVIVSASDSAFIDISLHETSLQGAEVVIEGAAEKGSAKRELEDRITSVVMTDGLSAEAMRKAPDPSVASVIRRATGVSVSGGDPIIRGLGIRYSKVTLNDAFVSGTEPNRSAVSLDLFPSSMMSQVTINKSYTPDQFGEFSGGTINMNTWDALGANELSVSVKTSVNSQTTGRNFLTYSGGGLDLLGYDDGTRALPDVIRNASTKITLRGQFSDIGYSAAELEALSKSFPNTWNTRQVTAGPNQSFNWSLSRGSSLFGKKLDYILSGRYSNASNFKEVERSIYKGGADNTVELQHNYNFEHYSRSVGLGGIAAFRWETSPLTRFRFQSMYNHELEDETRYFEGWNDDRGKNIQDTRLRFVSQNTYTNQLSGRHVMPSFAQSVLDWKVSHSLGTRYEPDTREFQYEANPGEAFVLADESQSGSRIFNDLTDHTITVSSDWQLHPEASELKLKTGFAVVNRWRDSETRFFQFEPQSYHTVDISRDPESIFSAEHINSSGFLVREATRPTDSYDAAQQIAAVYMMAEHPLTSKLRVIGGARIEQAHQEVNSYELFAASATPVKGELDNLDILPALNLIYALHERENLRLAASQTVSRPDFRELSAFEFTDIIGGHAVIGNPNLKRALIQNLDLRWEKMSGVSDLVAISAFYKHFHNPVEVTIQATAQNRVSYENAQGAENYGLEFEVRRQLGAIYETLDPFSMSVNLTLVQSDIQLSDSTAGIQTSSRRPLHGQSPYLLNAGLSYANYRSGTQADIFLHVFGKRIDEVGSKPLPDIYELPHPDLDFSLRQPLTSHFSLNGTAQNLLDPEIRFQQGDQYTEHYRLGRTYSLGLSYRR